MRKSLFILVALATMFLASCGESYDAKGLAKKFMTEQMGLKDYDVITWSNLDSTHHVKDSVLTAMHNTAIKNKIVKSGTQYQPRTEKLNLISVRYAVDKDTLMTTFYFDDKLTGIVGVKSDVK